MGFIFGRWVGTVLVVLAATIGATLVFLAARYLFADAARRRMGALGEKISAGFTENALSYLLFLRLVPLFPFFLVNLAPAFTEHPARDVRRRHVHRHHSRDVRLRESRRDARAHRFAVRARLAGDHRRLRPARPPRARAGVRQEMAIAPGRESVIRRRLRRPVQSRPSALVPVPSARCTPRCRSSKRPTFRRSPAARSTRCRSISATAATRRATTATSTRAPTARK